MITFFNPKAGNPFSVQYTNGSKVYKKEIVPNMLVAMKDLSTLSQIKNFSALTREGITIYDYTRNVYAFSAATFRTGFKGETNMTGMTFITPLVSVSTGWTFVTSAATAGVALNTITANTLGNTIRFAYSGAGVSTTAWLNALRTTAFSGIPFTIFGESPLNLITSGAATTVVLSAATASSTPYQAVFIGHNDKKNQYTTLYAMNYATTLSALRALVTGATS